MDCVVYDRRNSFSSTMNIKQKLQIPIPIPSIAAPMNFQHERLINKVMGASKM
jgi:hypothetical protein